MKLRGLERLLEGLESVPSARPAIEQYPTPPRIAAEVAFLALGKGDIDGRSVLDLGCGNGILAIAAARLGAHPVLGADIDPEAIEVARRNAGRAGIDVEWHVADVRDVGGRFDTVLMNPPFGSQTKHADLPFLDRALELGHVVYSFHNGKSELFVARRIRARGGRTTDRLEYAFPIRRTFAFHRDDERRVPVVLLRIIPKG